MLELEDVCAGKALRGVSLTVAAGETVAVWGARQSGRTTLLRVAAGLRPPDAGSVRSDGRVVLAELSWPQMGGERVVDQLALPLVARGMSIRSSRVAAMRVLAEHQAEEWIALNIDELDRAEHVRLAILRGLISEPSVLLIDDPTAVGEQPQEDAILALLRSARAGVGLLLTTGDAGVLAMADRIFTLRDGALCAPEPRTAHIIDFPMRGTG